VDLLRAIGNTSMVQIGKVLPNRCADVFVKLEWENPTGSLKDRMRGWQHEGVADQMAALGAELTLVPSEGGLTTKKLILDMTETARRLSQEPHTFWTDQLNNHDSIAGYSTPWFTALEHRRPRVGSPRC
jgi:cysteine synthase